MFENTEQKIIRNDEDSLFHQYFNEAQFSSDSIVEQLQYVRIHAPSEFIPLLTNALLAHELSHHPNIELKVSSKDLDYFYRGLVDMGRHLQPDLPEGITSYMTSRLEDFENKLAKELDKAKV